MSAWWDDFFDDDYLKLGSLFFEEQDNLDQANAIWSLLDLQPGCRLLDAPCGWGRLSRPFSELGATVLAVDQSLQLIAAAERARGGVPQSRLRYLQHDLRKPPDETNFDVACNIFTSFGYGTEQDDLDLSS